MKKNTTPSAKAAQKQKETVRALSMDEVEEALTKSTYGGEKKVEPLDEDDNIIKDIEAENEQLRKNAEEAERCYNGVRIELMERNKEITKLKKTIEELRAINEEWANSDEQKIIKDLKDEISELNNILIKVRQENKDLTKTISKMKYEHDEEVRALEDDLAEAKILGKKANEYSHVLDDDSCAFERILNLTDTLKCQAEAIRGVVSLIENETEARV